MDLNKLTPAPWEVICDVESGGFFIPSPTGFPMLLPEEDDEECLDQLRFCALARNAYDVKIRRGWSEMRVPKGWIVVRPTFADQGWQYFPVLHPGTVIYQFPLVGLVEADNYQSKEEVAHGISPQQAQR